MKELFFSDSNDDGRIGKNARRMMSYLSISVDEDLQLTLSFFEKVNKIPHNPMSLCITSIKKHVLLSICLTN